MKETVSSRVITETERACRGSAQVQTDRVLAPRWAVDKSSHPQPRINKHSQRKNSFLHGSLTGDKPHLRAGPMLSSSQHKRNSMVFTGDFLFPFSTHIVLSGLCFFLKRNLLVFSLYIMASSFVFLWVCVYLCAYIFLVLFLLLFVHFHSALLLFFCFVLFPVSFLQRLNAWGRRSRKVGESGKRWGKGTVSISYENNFISHFKKLKNGPY